MLLAADKSPVIARSYSDEAIQKPKGSTETESLWSACVSLRPSSWKMWNGVIVKKKSSISDASNPEAQKFN